MPRDNEGMLGAYGIRGCGCWTCVDEVISARPWPDSIMFPFIVCDTCGNKRCPHAEHHALPCTGSNEPGQSGAVRYPKVSRESPLLTREEMFARMDEITDRLKPRGGTNERRER